MPFTGVADSEQLSAMTAVLDGFCEERGICPDSSERAEAARLVLMLFEGGWRTPDELKLALAWARPQPHRPRKFSPIAAEAGGDRSRRRQAPRSLASP